ncbi:hypothetical protein GCM10023238_29550 [Streptomyces heliomycini]
MNKALGEGRRSSLGAAFRSVRDIDGPVDLAVVAVPAEHVPDVVTECGEHGVQGLVDVSAATPSPPRRPAKRQRASYAGALVRDAIIARTAFGVINTSPDVRLNASLAPGCRARAASRLFAQSGAIGVALLSRLHRRGGGRHRVTGVSTFVSSGNRADVSGNDLLQYCTRTPTPTSS